MKRLIIGISGASGTIYAATLIKTCRELNIETHVVISEGAMRIIEMETDYDLREIKSMGDYLYDNSNIGGAIASGSFKTDGMIVVPCSIRTLSGIANSYNENLLTRAADVTLKEGRKLVLVVRETPLHIGHLELMVKVARTGAVILPPMPAFYHKPATIQDIVNHTVGRVLDQFEIEANLFERWGSDFKDGEGSLLKI